MATRSFSATDVVATAVPAIVLLSTAFLLGYFATVGLGYFTFLDFQDYLNSAAAFLPGIAVFYSFTFAAGYFSKHKEGSRHLDSIQTPAEIARRKEAAPGDPMDTLFDAEKGRWRDDRVLALKAGTLLAFIVFFGAFASSLYGIDVPLWLLWPSMFAFVFLGQWLLAYFDERYEYGFRPAYMMGISFALLAFCYGVTASRIDEGSPARYHVTTENGAIIEATTVRRVGEAFLVFDFKEKSWKLFPREGVASLVKTPPS